MKATIGVHLVEAGDSGESSLQFLAQSTDPRHTIILLPELDFEGGAAALNRLFRMAETEVLVLLESGCRPGPGWLELLLDVLNENPSHGLAGPSTNRSRNEQAVFPKAGDSEENIRAVAQSAAATYRKRKRTLAPLYNLGDFCLAIRREVLEVIEGADEGYGAGPCWEMDFSIRAVRAGFKDFWVGASYVYRAPEGPKRRERDQLLLESNRRRYQSKFCGRQLRAPASTPAFFRNHCAGDACPNFAPAVGTSVTITRESRLPLVTCIMPTSGRREFVPISIEQFLAQDYPRAELLVLDDGPDPVEDLIPANSKIRYFRLDGKLPIGPKRNRACELAEGTLIAHWDDDDWYPPWRLARQVGALLEAKADVCGTATLYFFDPRQRKAFEYRYGGSDPWLSGNSMLYTKAFWSRHQFSDLPTGEDALFVKNCWPQRLCDLADPALAIARLHNHHTSPKATSGLYWKPLNEELVEEALRRHRWPLVSCLMPTFNRTHFLPIAYELFRAQDYPRAELVILDDGPLDVWELAAKCEGELSQLWRDPRVHYVRLKSRVSLGEKRNLACRAAKGDILIHWDDDDWYAKNRISYQVEPILRDQADITGLENSFTFDVSGCQFWTSDARLMQAMFAGGVHGGTLAFRRSILGPSVAYPPVNIAEDAGLLNAARANGARILSLANPGIYAYVRHGSNTWQFQAGEYVNGQWWKPCPPPAQMDDTILERIQAASLALRAGRQG